MQLRIHFDEQQVTCAYCVLESIFGKSDGFIPIFLVEGKVGEVEACLAVGGLFGSIDTVGLGLSENRVLGQFEVFVEILNGFIDVVVLIVELRGIVVIVEHEHQSSLVGLLKFGIDFAFFVGRYVILVALGVRLDHLVEQGAELGRVEGHLSHGAVELVVEELGIVLAEHIVNLCLLGGFGVGQGLVEHIDSTGNVLLLL